MAIEVEYKGRKLIIDDARIAEIQKQTREHRKINWKQIGRNWNADDEEEAILKLELLKHNFEYREAYREFFDKLLEDGDDGIAAFHILSELRSRFGLERVTAAYDPILSDSEFIEIFDPEAGPWVMSDRVRHYLLPYVLLGAAVTEVVPLGKSPETHLPLAPIGTPDDLDARTIRVDDLIVRKRRRRELDALLKSHRLSELPSLIEEEDATYYRIDKREDPSSGRERTKELHALLPYDAANERRLRLKENWESLRAFQLGCKNMKLKEIGKEIGEKKKNAEKLFYRGFELTQKREYIPEEDFNHLLSAPRWAAELRLACLECKEREACANSATFKTDRKKGHTYVDRYPRIGIENWINNPMREDSPSGRQKYTRYLNHYRFNEYISSKKHIKDQHPFCSIIDRYISYDHLYQREMLPDAEEISYSNRPWPEPGDIAELHKVTKTPEEEARGNREKKLEEAVWEWEKTPEGKRFKREWDIREKRLALLNSEPPPYEPEGETNITTAFRRNTVAVGWAEDEVIPVRPTHKGDTPVQGYMRELLYEPAGAIQEPTPKEWYRRAREYNEGTKIRYHSKQGLGTNEWAEAVDVLATFSRIAGRTGPGIFDEDFINYQDNPPRGPISPKQRGLIEDIDRRFSEEFLRAGRIELSRILARLPVPMSKEEYDGMLVNLSALGFKIG